MKFAKVEFVAPEALLLVEQRYFDAAGPRELYNSSLVAGNCMGVKHSAETRAKLSKLRAGRKHSPEAIARMRVAQAGRSHSQETKARLSAMKAGIPTATNTSGYAGVTKTSQGRWFARAGSGPRRKGIGVFDTPEQAAAAICRYNADPASYVKPKKPVSVVRHTPESRRKMSEAHKLRGPVSAETRAKLSKAHKGRKRDPAHCARMSDQISRAKSKTGIKGVSVAKTGHFFAQVGRVKLGRFKTIEEAVAAREAYLATIV